MYLIRSWSRHRDGTGCFRELLNSLLRELHPVDKLAVCGRGPLRN